MNSMTPATETSVRKVLDGIEDPDLAARYPAHTHFIGADHPRSGAMATRALFHGEPVVLIYPDGRELLFTPEQAKGIVAVFLIVAAGLMWVRSRLSKDADGEVIQFPPKTKIEPRDSRGLPLAA
jgi:hypothetical protein